jgi:agmatinase
MDEIDERGLSAVLDDAIAHAAARAPRTYLTVDIDVLDPAFAPGTGTPEVGGLSTSEALAFVRALRGIDIVGADVVEVSPPYDGPGQQTALAAANIAYEILSLRASAQG